MKDVRLMPGEANIDPKTRYTLFCINQECVVAVYNHLRRGLMKKEVDDSKLQEAMSLLKSSKTSDAAKAKLKQLLKMGAFDPTVEKTIDEAFEHNMDLCLTEKINKAIKSGKLPPPSKGIRQDEFSRRMARRMQNKKP